MWPFIQNACLEHNGRAFDPVSFWSVDLTLNLTGNIWKIVNRSKFDFYSSYKLIEILAKMRLHLITHLILWQFTNEKHLKDKYDLDEIENDDLQVSKL